MRIALRTDASRRIGTGHLRRCISLAQALQQEGAQLLFVGRPHDEVSQLIADTGLPHAWLPAPAGCTPDANDPPHAAWAACSWSQDAGETIGALRDFRPDWVLVDHYAFDARWHARVAQDLACRVAVIDDLADRPIAAALLVDQNLADHALKYAGRIAAGTRLLGGPRYALLAPPYRDAKRYRFRRQAASIGIFMGGADPLDFSSRALLACREQAGFQGEIELVSSSRNPHLDRHLELARRWPGTRVLCDAPELSGFFARHDLQIGSGGVAAWERCCLGAPTLAIQIAENQRAVLPQLAALGAIEWLAAGDPDERALGAAVQALVQSPRRRLALVRGTRELVDGLGSARVAAALALSAGAPLAWRNAEAGDETLLLHWANDPEARRHALNPGAIAPRGHHLWFSARLARPADCRILIARSPAGTPVGQVRFEREGSSWTVSYSLDAAFRGLRLARPLLEGAIAALRAAVPSPALVAWVKPDNAASLQIFRGMGFQEALASHQGVDCHRFELHLVN
ncbi:hypothetical protein GCM10027034_23830 [Ramlibacter solisilvae]|uniref:UDP-2,4-diacetamido-2,4, 6-trideoxy-beta-L-altropyranose hydrolase n=1 Tax=Ramlibacter tataouinensis TaxID=94132 RepID=UPI00077713DB|nr:UDP-2,4-diacetamido-2,4,6-trideoxy-beta-L-altropyranose hydrolase [Ramlibacter tataouinensis]